MYSVGVMLYEIGLWRNVPQQRQSGDLRPSLQTHTSDPHFVEKVLMSGLNTDSKRYTGIKYEDAIKTSLSREFDAYLDKQSVDRQKQLRSYLGQVQTKVVDAIAACNA